MEIDGKKYRRTSFHTRRKFFAERKMQEYFARKVDAVLEEIDGEYFIYIIETDEVAD